MLFPTVDYGIFFVCAFAGAWSLRRNLHAHKALLLVASWGFYAYWDWRFLPLLIGIGAWAGAVALALQRYDEPRLRKALVAVGIGGCLSTLALFKYLGFAAASALWVLELLGLHPGPVRLPELALPVGLSFFVFHAISLIVDAWRRQIPVRVRMLDALLYVAFFPQLVAGPILRAGSFLPQLAAPPSSESIDLSRAVELICCGLAKKVLIAQLLATRLVDPVFESPGSHPGLEVLLAVYGYAVQIYCDFSGYTDLAIGSALLLGYRMPDNFDAPYRASSPQDFWRRWHISLSTWLRDYLFIPLGGSRTGHTALNLMVTMILGGLWHGAALSFIAWGALHGAGLVVHRRWSTSTLGAIRRLRAWPLWGVVAPLLTFHFVCLGWVLFRAPSLAVAWELLGALGHGGWNAPVSAAVLLAIAVGLFAPLFPAGPWTRLRERFSRFPLMLQGAVLASVVLVIEAVGPRGIAPFIYFRF